MLEESSRSLPPLALHPATAVLFLLLLRAMFKTPHASGRLLLFVLWLRYVMQAYHEVTFLTVAGVSINALGSLLVCCVGGIVLARQIRELPRYPLILSLLAVIALSGLINGVLQPTIETLLKWGYFLIVMLAAQDCLRRDGDARILGLLLWAFAPPLVYQALSIGLGVSKATENDGSTSFVGGYNHEAAFSIVLITGFAVASLAPRLSSLWRMILLVAFAGGIFAANYRTALIAVAPMAFGYLVFGIAQAARPGRRLVMSIIGLIVICGGLAAANMALSERMNDLVAVARESDELIRPPEEFTASEQKLLSGRLYIWNRYLDDYAAGNEQQILIGLGPDAWVDRFGVYAHNTLVSYLYEFGLIGAVLVVLVWLAMLGRTFRVRDWTLRGQLVCTHIGFILLNMATMPFWQIEGLIFYGVLCAYTVVLSPAPASSKPLLHRIPLPEGRMPDWWVNPPTVATPRKVQEIEASARTARRARPRDILR